MEAHRICGAYHEKSTLSCTLKSILELYPDIDDLQAQKLQIFGHNQGM